MKEFLHKVATNLIKRYGNDLSSLTIVFPGKRASIFMNECLTQVAQGPVWAPRYTTIDELFLKNSHYTPSEPLTNVCELYNVYNELFPDQQTLDEFYGWGEIIMHDFEDIDKHMVDAEHLFLNAAELNELEHDDYLTDAQKAAVRRFFSEFEDNNLTRMKENFRRIWQAMPQLYRGVHQRLANRNLMYKAAIYREVAENIASFHNIPNGECYAFIGFNILDEVESTLFDAYKSSGNALFYWDYDNFYIKEQNDNEAGMFIRQNLERYPNALQDSYDDLLNNGKLLTYIATSTNNAQVRYLPTWLQQHQDIKKEDCAIVLCDESLMKSVLHAIPSTEEEDYAPESLNITMGFPIIDIPIHGYLMTLLDLQTDGYDEKHKRFRYTSVQRLKENTFYRNDLNLEYQADNASALAWLSQQMEELGLSINELPLTDVYKQLYTEATFQLYCTLNQFHKLVEDGVLNVERATLRRFIRQALRGLSIPFHGDVNKGLQVMGLLETRNLDFEHLAILSAGEGFLPKKPDETSLIPYTLKVAYGLNTIERQTAVFAYYFFRLLQRAKDVTLLYNDTPSGTSANEISRYLLQLQAETNLPIRSLRLSSTMQMQSANESYVEKTPEIMERLGKRFDAKQGGKHDLSPSAINTYLKCPMQFYFQHVAEIKVPRRPEEGINATLFGTILHDTAEFFYRRHMAMRKSQTFEKEDYKQILDSKDSMLGTYLNLMFYIDVYKADKYDSYTNGKERDAFLQPFIDEVHDLRLKQAIDKLYADADIEFTGTNIVIRDVIRRYLITLLHWDQQHAPITISGLELPVHTSLDIETADGTRTIRTGGRIDRLDRITIDGKQYLRILDYKTGKKHDAPSNIEDAFDIYDSKKAQGYYLQTLLYAMILHDQYPQEAIRPALFYVTEAQKEKEKYTPDMQWGSRNTGKKIEVVTEEEYQEYRYHLKRVMTEIFDPENPFICTKDLKHTCEYCDFYKICKN